MPDWTVMSAPSVMCSNNVIRRVTPFIEEVWPPYITTTMPVSSDFGANETFTMQYDANLEYTSQSQYLSNVTLTGSKQQPYSR